jgi:hypothetical protein
VHAGPTKGAKAMDQAAVNTVTKALLTNIHRKLQEAASIAKAAEVCAESGNIQTAVKMVMDTENLTHQVDRMLSAALLIRNELVD